MIGGTRNRYVEWFRRKSFQVINTVFPSDAVKRTPSAIAGCNISEDCKFEDGWWSLIARRETPRKIVDVGGKLSNSLKDFKWIKIPRRQFLTPTPTNSLSTGMVWLPNLLSLGYLTLEFVQQDDLASYIAPLGIQSQTIPYYTISGEIAYLKWSGLKRNMLWGVVLANYPTSESVGENKSHICFHTPNLCGHTSRCASPPQRPSYTRGIDRHRSLQPSTLLFISVQYSFAANRHYIFWGSYSAHRQCFRGTPK